MVEPTDEKLYNTVKKKIYKEQPQHSAYRSGTGRERIQKTIYQEIWKP